MTTSERAREPQARKPRKPREMSRSVVANAPGESLPSVVKPSEAEIARRNATQREIAAQWIASGVSQQRAADEAQVELRTVQRWLLDDDFRVLVDQYRASAVNRAQPDALRNLMLAYDVERRVLAEELAADSDAYKVAARLLADFRSKHERAAPNVGDAANQPTVSVVVHGGGDGVDRRPIDVESR